MPEPDFEARHRIRTNHASMALRTGHIIRGSWRRSIILVVAIVIGVSVTTGVLLAVLVGGSTQVERLDLVRTALTVGAGAGALVTLLYAIRRQLLGEQAADDARMDAKEKRVTELYVKGIEQFSSERAVAKIGGLYALEKLADDEPRLGEVVVNG